MTRREEDGVVVIIIVDAPMAFGRRAWWSSVLGYVKGIGIGRKSKARIEEVFHLDLARNLGTTKNTTTQMRDLYNHYKNIDTTMNSHRTYQIDSADSTAAAQSSA
jgi:hypothetical protein